MRAAGLESSHYQSLMSATHIEVCEELSLLVFQLSTRLLHHVQLQRKNTGAHWQNETPFSFYPSLPLTLPFSHPPSPFPCFPFTLSLLPTPHIPPAHSQQVSNYRESSKTSLSLPSSSVHTNLLPKVTQLFPQLC